MKNRSDMLFKTLLLAASGVIMLGSCDEPSAKANSTTPEVTTTPVQQAHQEAPASNFTNGITEANSGSVSGPIELKGRIDRPLAESRVFLYRTEGKDNFVIDSTSISNQAFSFGTKTYDVGVYTLGLGSGESNLGSIILNPSEKVVEVGIRSSKLSSGLYAVNSRENEGWIAYQKTELSTQNGIRTLRKQASGSPLRAKFEEQIKIKEQQLIDTQASMITEYPNTFLAKVLTWKQSKYKTDKNRYWDDIDWTDESIIATPIIPDRVQEYMVSFSGGTDSGFMNGIDLLALKSSETPRLKQFTLYTLLEGFYSSGKDGMCLYILEDYIYDGGCGDTELSDELITKANGVANLQLGNQPPNFTIKTHDNKSTIDLYQTAAQNEYTLVMFWSSWCHKCEQEIPELKKVYDTYHAKGFEVIGVSVDTQRSQWVEAIEARDISWPNVSQLKLWDSPVAKDYRVNSTPTLFLIDKNLKIVGKPVRIHEVQNFLQQNI